MKRSHTLMSILAFCLLLSHNSHAQYRYHRKKELHWKQVSTLSAGPETIIAFPPKVSFYVFEPLTHLFYSGIDLNIGTLGFSNSIGGTLGFQYKSLVLENCVSRTSLHQYKAPNEVWISNNVKIGCEYKSFSLKAGPSFILSPPTEHNGARDILTIGGQRFNIEIGIVINSRNR